MQFQSTRPSRGETGSPLMIQNANFLFQSTRPSRGETIPLLIYDEHKVISIHSPLAGRDQRLSTRTLISVRFQSTRPSRGETNGRTVPQNRGNHFNPLAPRGARHGTRGLRGRDYYFNPLAPRGARRRWTTGPSTHFLISIHSPLAGRDTAEGGRKTYSLISIHSPLAGRDVLHKVARSKIDDFNPLAPRGARPQKVTKYFLQKPFLLHNTYPCRFKIGPIRRKMRYA